MGRRQPRAREAFRSPEPPWPGEEPRAECRRGCPRKVFRGQGPVWLGGVVGGEGHLEGRAQSLGAPARRAGLEPL